MSNIRHISCAGCNEVMVIITGGKVEVQEKNENPYEELYCEECYRRQKEIVDSVRDLIQCTKTNIKKERK